MKIDFVKPILLVLGFVIFLHDALPQKSKSSLLWKIEGKGIEQPSYLFGTIHLICPEDFEMFAQVKEAIKSSDIVFLELDMDDSTLMMSMQTKLLNPGMRNFTQDLDLESRKTLDDFFETNFGVGLDQLGVMKPFALMTMMYTKYMGCPISQSYEAAIIQEAKLKNIEVKGLETLDYQLGLFDQIAFKDMIEWLVDGTDIEKNTKVFSEMISSYKSKNVDKLYEFSMKNSPEIKAYADLLLAGRNKNWIPIIEQNIKQRASFFGVGAGHLGGKQGVVSLLKQKGYTLTPIEL